MNQPIERCPGKDVPFGIEYSSECKTCARSSPVDTDMTVWIGPITFDTVCPSKIKDES